MCASYVMHPPKSVPEIHYIYLFMRNAGIFLIACGAMSLFCEPATGWKAQCTVLAIAVWFGPISA
eukprot:6208384-Pleurochrysis_carterae.AAC.1